MKKQIIITCLLAVFTLGITACNKTSNQEKETPKQEAAATTETAEEAPKSEHKHEEGHVCDPEACKKHNHGEGHVCDPENCKHKDGHAHAKEGETETAEASAQAAYICPMKCEGSASSEAGKCPVCKMELEKAE
jgi:hypothetical protein